MDVKFNLAGRCCTLSTKPQDSDGWGNACEGAHDDGAAGVACMSHYGCSQPSFGISRIVLISSEKQRETGGSLCFLECKKGFLQDNVCVEMRRLCSFGKACAARRRQ